MSGTIIRFIPKRLCMQKGDTYERKNCKSDAF